MKLFFLVAASLLCFTRGYYATFSIHRLLKKDCTLSAKGFGVKETDPISMRPRIREALSKPCPCCSGQLYQNCCYPLHAEITPVSKIEPFRTVQARFAAYALGLGEYLIATLHPISEVSKN